MQQDFRILLVLFLLLGLLLTSCEPSLEDMDATAAAETASAATSINNSSLTPEVAPTDPTVLSGQELLVSSNEDNGPNTLRRALLDAQSGDVISFDPVIFPPGRPETILLSSELPPIQVNNLTLDASNAGVILDGSLLSGDWDAGLKIISGEEITIFGLQVIRFPGPGIEINGGRHNKIGGDKVIGGETLGQGNLISDNSLGIIVMNSSDNTIEGNYIGTDLTGDQGYGNLFQGIYLDNSSHNQIISNLISDNGASGITLQGAGSHDNILIGNIIGTNPVGILSLGNHNNGIEIREGASNNRIGHGNVAAHNDWSGIAVFGDTSLNNYIIQNNIYQNGWLGIDVWGGGNLELPRPVITEYDLSNGYIEGIAYPSAEISVFTTDTDEGDIYIGSIRADNIGYFSFVNETSYSLSHFVITATDSNGNTSEFSLPTYGDSGSLSLQFDNPLPMSLLDTLQSADQEDNRIASFWHSLWGYEPLSELLDEARYMGAKRFRFAINGGEADKVDWSKPEFTIDPTHEDFINSLFENDIQMTYNLIFWDLETWPGGVGAPCPRFKTEEDIQHYLDYVRFAVRHFKDRIQYYEIWNEPDNTACPQWILPEDYINLVRRTVPVIREEYPEAKIQVGSIILSGYTSQSYLFQIIESDIMPLVDVISWHPFYGDSPEQSPNYYYAYPSIVDQIKTTAHSHGFTGEFEADEMNWRPYSNPENEPHRRSYGEIAHTKYWLRGILMNLGMDVTAGNLRIPHSMSTASFAVRNLSTIMQGNSPLTFPVDHETEVIDVKTYGYELPNGEKLLAIWNDDIAADYDPGMLSTLVFPGRAGQSAIGIDVLNGFEQELVSTDEGNDLVINDFYIRDYPIIIRLLK